MFLQLDILRIRVKLVDVGSKVVVGCGEMVMGWDGMGSQMGMEKEENLWSHGILGASYCLYYITRPRLTVIRVSSYLPCLSTYLYLR